jgi:transposase-like protein
MSKKRRNFSAEFKAKVVIELLEGEKTVSEIASKYDLLPRSVQQWKKQFLEDSVLAFDIGGNSDMIEHKVNGYLAKPFDTKEMTESIEFILNNDKYDNLCKNSRRKVFNNFQKSIIIEKYLNIYNRLI